MILVVTYFCVKNRKDLKITWKKILKTNSARLVIFRTKIKNLPREFHGRYVGCQSLLQTEFHCLFNNDPYQLHSRESVCIQKDTIYDTRLVDRSIFISITIAAGFFAKVRNSMTLPFDLLSELALLNFGLKHIIQCVFSQGKSAIDHRHTEFQSNLN